MWVEVVHHNQGPCTRILADGVCRISRRKGSPHPTMISLPKRQAVARGIWGYTHFRLYIDRGLGKIGLQLLKDPKPGQAVRKIGRGTDMRFLAAVALRKLGATPGFYRWTLEREGQFVIVFLKQPVSPEEAIRSKYGPEGGEAE